MKPIRFSGHARQQLIRRGMLEEEALITIRTEEWQSAQGTRLECRRDFPFAREWNGKFYQTKQVRPIFVDEASNSKSELFFMHTRVNCHFFTQVQGKSACFGQLFVKTRPDFIKNSQNNDRVRTKITLLLD